MMKNGLLGFLALIGFCASVSAGEMVEVTAKIVPVGQLKIEGLSQIELKKELSLARSRGTQDLLRLGSLVESGKWATIRSGREFWYPKTYSDPIVHKGKNDSGEYSIPFGSKLSSKSTLVFPNSPMEMNREMLGSFLKVRPVLQEGGLISLEGVLRDSVFEGLSEEAIPINVKTKQVIRGKREHLIVESRTDSAVFHRFEKDFKVMLPYAAGTSENARRLREAQSKYDYLIPMTLGKNVFGATGKIDLGKSVSNSKGPIKSTVLKATMLKDRLIHRKPNEVEPTRNAILVLEVRKVLVKTQETVGSATTGEVKLSANLFESEEAPQFDSLIIGSGEIQSEQKRLNQLKNHDALSTAKLVVKSGDQAKIEVVREFSFPVKFAKPSLDSPDWEKNYAKPEAFETRQLGVTLLAKPKVLPGGKEVSLQIEGTLYELEGLLDYGNPIMKVETKVAKRIKSSVGNQNRVEMPILPIRSIETEVVIPIGSAAVISMIYDEYNAEMEKGRLIPLGQPKVSETVRPRYLTLMMRVDGVE